MYLCYWFVQSKYVEFYHKTQCLLQDMGLKARNRKVLQLLHHVVLQARPHLAAITEALYLQNPQLPVELRTFRVDREHCGAKSNDTEQEYVTVPQDVLDLYNDVTAENTVNYLMRRAKTSSDHLGIPCMGMEQLNLNAPERELNPADGYQADEPAETCMMEPLADVVETVLQEEIARNQQVRPLYMRSRNESRQTTKPSICSLCSRKRLNHRVGLRNRWK